MSPTTMRLTREEATFVIDYSKYLNDRARVIKPSGIRRFFDIANEMEDVISLSIGEPDFSTPWHIRQVGIKTLEDVPARLRDAVAALLQEDGHA